MLQDLGEVIEVKNNLKEDIQRMYNNREEIIWDKYKSQMLCIQTIPYIVSAPYLLPNDNTVYYDESLNDTTQMSIYYRTNNYYNYDDETYYKIGKRGEWIKVTDSDNHTEGYGDVRECRITLPSYDYTRETREIYIKSNRRIEPYEYTQTHYGVFGFHNVSVYTSHKVQGREVRESFPFYIKGNLLSLYYGDDFHLYDSEPEGFNTEESWTEGYKEHLWYGTPKNLFIGNTAIPNEEPTITLPRQLVEAGYRVTWHL